MATDREAYDADPVLRRVEAASDQQQAGLHPAHFPPQDKVGALAVITNSIKTEASSYECEPSTLETDTTIVRRWWVLALRAPLALAMCLYEACAYLSTRNVKNPETTGVLCELRLGQTPSLMAYDIVVLDRDGCRVLPGTTLLSPKMPVGGVCDTQAPPPTSFVVLLP